jgi:hypothetical protein
MSESLQRDLECSQRQSERELCFFQIRASGTRAQLTELAAELLSYSKLLDGITFGRGLQRQHDREAGTVTLDFAGVKLTLAVVAPAGAPARVPDPYVAWVVANEAALVECSGQYIAIHLQQGLIAHAPTFAAVLVEANRVGLTEAVVFDRVPWTSDPHEVCHQLLSCGLCGRWLTHDDRMGIVRDGLDQHWCLACRAEQRAERRAAKR